MSSKSVQSDQHLLWLDLEMTGLVPGQDVILEVAAIVTDWDFTEIASYEAIVHQPDDVLVSMNPWCIKHHGESGLTQKVRESIHSSQQVEKALISFMKEHCDTHRPVVLAGNSIHIDRQFIHAQWPFFEQLLHYRMLDVTAWKIVFEAKYGAKNDKKESHRALGDVRESIAELKMYMERISV